MSKKLHLKDMRRDEVAEAVTHAAKETFEFSREHRRTLLYGVLAVLAVAVIGVIVAWRLEASRTAAAAAYSEASLAWARAAGERELPAGMQAPTWDEVAASLGRVAEEHGSSAPGRIAQMQQGVALLHAGKPAAAVPVLQGFVDEHPSHWAAPEALAALAAAHEDAGDAAAAEQALGRLRDGRWRSWPDGAAQVLLAQLYERQGRQAEARTIYETLSVSENLKDTTWGGQARARLAELGDAPAAG